MTYLKNKEKYLFEFSNTKRHWKLRKCLEDTRNYNDVSRYIGAS